MPAETTQMAFTDAQAAWLERWLEKRCPAAGRSLDRATQMWITGGLTALGVVAFGVLRAEIGSARAELQQEVRENRAAIAGLAKGLARIETILNERLPRPG